MATYLITQATGKQARWTITHLLTAGAKVHAVVRDLEKASEIPLLKSEGVTLFKGESVNLEEVLQAAQGCQGAFLNTFPIPGLEAQQAKTVVEACNKAGIKTIVAATTFATDKPELWDNELGDKVDLRDYYRSKKAIEDAVRDGNFEAYTILRPGLIHIDYMVPHSTHNWGRLPSHGIIDHAFDDGAKLPQTDCSDVGKYAAAALLDPAKFGGQEITVINENLSIDEAADIISRVSGRKVTTEKGEVTVLGQRFHLLANAIDFNHLAAAAREKAVKLGMPFGSLEAALLRDREWLLESLPASA
ncbi:NmrA-like family protein [Xylariaceae sp. FL1272]|nr:NmrA-like family protein [Xylariaceae sp. FL1272]